MSDKIEKFAYEILDDPNGKMRVGTIMTRLVPKLPFFLIQLLMKRLMVETVSLCKMMASSIYSTTRGAKV